MQRALEGLDGVHGAKVELASGEATVEVGAEVAGELLEKAVRGTVIISWARDILAHLRREAR